MFAEMFSYSALWPASINQDVGSNRGKVAGQLREGDDRPINIYNSGGGGHDPHDHHPHNDDSHDDRLRRLERFMYGDGLGEGVGYPGVLRHLTEIIRQQAEMITQFRSMMLWLYVVTALLIFQGVLMAIYTFAR